MRTTALVLSLALGGCVGPLPAPDYLSTWRTRPKKRPPTVQQEAAASLEAAGGYGPKPTQAGLDRVQNAVRQACLDPDSFELLEIHTHTGEPIPTSIYYRQQWHHGWYVLVLFRATNAFGAKVPGTVTVLIRDDIPIIVKDQHN